MPGQLEVMACHQLEYGTTEDANRLAREVDEGGTHAAGRDEVGVPGRARDLDVLVRVLLLRLVGEDMPRARVGKVGSSRSAR